MINIYTAIPFGFHKLYIINFVQNQYPVTFLIKGSAKNQVITTTGTRTKLTILRKFASHACLQRANSLRFAQTRTMETSQKS